MIDKIIEISGLCTNCDNARVCDFIREFKAFIRDRKCADKVLDTEMGIYSCNGYESIKEIIPADNMCLYCKQEV